MKKTIILSLFVLSSTLAFSQAQPPKQKPIVLQLTPEGIELLLKGLYELPAKESVGLIQYIQNQAQAQIQAQQNEQAAIKPKDSTVTVPPAKAQSKPKK